MKRLHFTDNKAALLVVLTAQVGVVKDAIEEINQVNSQILFYFFIFAGIFYLSV